jgi:tRNA-dihydrouridine synthase
MLFVKRALIFILLISSLISNAQRDTSRSEVNTITIDSASRYDADVLAIVHIILNGEYTPADDSATFELLDSMVCVNDSFRRLYQQIVINHILPEADGALSEVFNGRIAEMFFEYPCEFAELENDFPRLQVEVEHFSWYLEYYPSNNNFERIRLQAENRINRNCPEYQRAWTLKFKEIVQLHQTDR